MQCRSLFVPIAFVFVVVSAAAFAGGSNEKTSGASAQSTGGSAMSSSVTLNVEAQGGDAKTRAVQDQLRAFEKQTGINVNIISVPIGNMTQKTLLDLKTNAKQYDVVMVPWSASLPT